MQKYTDVVLPKILDNLAIKRDVLDALGLCPMRFLTVFSRFQALLKFYGSDCWVYPLILHALSHVKIMPFYLGFSLECNCQVGRSGE